MSGIVGLGTDLVDSRRVELLLHRYPQRFVQRLFVPHEQIYCHQQAYPALAFAKRMAAKEAFSKAVGWGIGIRLSWRDVWIETHSSGAPCLGVCANARARITQAKGPFQAWVSLTDEAPYALAFVVLSRSEG